MAPQGYTTPSTLGKRTRAEPQTLHEPRIGLSPVHDSGDDGSQHSATYGTQYAYLPETSGAHASGSRPMSQVMGQSRGPYHYFNPSSAYNAPHISYEPNHRGVRVVNIDPLALSKAVDDDTGTENRPSKRTKLQDLRPQANASGYSPPIQPTTFPHGLNNGSHHDRVANGSLVDGLFASNPMSTYHLTSLPSKPPRACSANGYAAHRPVAHVSIGLAAARAYLNLQQWHAPPPLDFPDVDALQAEIYSAATDYSGYYDNDPSIRRLLDGTIGDSEVSITCYHIAVSDPLDLESCG